LASVAKRMESYEEACTAAGEQPRANAPEREFIHLKIRERAFSALFVRAPGRLFDEAVILLQTSHRQLLPP